MIQLKNGIKTKWIKNTIEENNMTRKAFIEASGNFSIYGVVRFTTYMMSATAIYLENFQIAAIAFGFGATLGFIRRLARIWE